MDGPWTLTLVSAPAGSGKTRLLLQWAQDLRADAEIALVWVALERGEADLPLVRAALERIDDPGLQDALSQVSSLRSAATARALARALSEARGRIVVVVDDVHRVEDEETAQLISTFVQNAPGNVHVVLSGRGTRAIPLARRRIAGVALELDARALAFDPTEVRAFFRTRGIRLSQGEISSVLSRTEGWATGLQLMMLDAAGRRPCSPVRSAETPPKSRTTSSRRSSATWTASSGLSWRRRRSWRPSPPNSPQCSRKPGP